MISRRKELIRWKLKREEGNNEEGESYFEMKLMSFTKG
jgi:hypothetical protein